MKSAPEIKPQKTTEQNPQKKASKPHPLKGVEFFAIPKHIAMMKGVNANIAMLISVLCSAYGEDGHIEFKLKTLERYMNREQTKSHSALRNIISDTKKLGLITTKQTGRSIIFEFTDKFYDSRPKLKIDRKTATKNDRKRAPENEQPECQETSNQSASILALSYKQQKKGLKETTTTNLPQNPPCEQTPAPQKSPPNLVVVDDNFKTIKSMIEDKALRSDFNAHTLTSLKKLCLTIGQIKSLVLEANKRPNVKSWGYFIAMIKNGVLSNIEDADKIEAENERKLEKTIENEQAISKRLTQEAFEINEKAGRYDAFIDDMSDDDLRALCDRLGIVCDREQLKRPSIRYKAEKLMRPAEQKIKKARVVPKPPKRKSKRYIFIKYVPHKNTSIIRTKNSVIYDYRQATGKRLFGNVFDNPDFLKFMAENNIEMRLENDE